MTSEDDFAPIWEESILLAEHEAVQASVDVGGWLSAALDDPNVCEQMKADINRWFSAGFLYLDSVRQLMQADREAVRAALGERAMTSELRPAVEVATEICGCAYADQRKRDIAVIEADREAVRAEQAAELAKWKALAETLAGALEEWDELIKHPYFGSREAMSDMNYAAQRGLKALRQYKEARDA